MSSSATEPLHRHRIFVCLIWFDARSTLWHGLSSYSKQLSYFNLVRLGLQAQVTSWLLFSFIPFLALIEHPMWLHFFSIFKHINYTFKYFIILLYILHIYDFLSSYYAFIASPSPISNSSWQLTSCTRTSYRVFPVPATILLLVWLCITEFYCHRDKMPNRSNVRNENLFYEVFKRKWHPS